VAVLGTPSVRFNDFVGRLSYLDELENRYQLTFGIPTNQRDALLDKVKELVSDQDVKKQFAQRREAMLNEKENLADLWFEFLLNYRKGRDIPGFYSPQATR
jgi:predicted glycosyltransferase